MHVRAAAAALAANAFWLALVGASSAGAQDYGPPPGAYPNAPGEQVIVSAPYPRARVDHPHLNVPIENVSLSQPVYYGDLDLRSREGAHALRMRIRETAYAVCSQLIDMYPVGEETDDRCFRDAVAQSMARADAAIHNARSYPPGRYRDVNYGGD